MLRSGGIALVGIVVLAAALRFATLGLQSFSDDELFTVWLVKMPFHEMVSTVPRSEATPHLFYIVEWAFARVFGTGEAGMRVLPALAGLLTVPVVYATGALAASRRVGLAAALFVAVNPFLIWYSQEARAYSLLVFFSALALMWYLDFRRRRRAVALAGWALASALALATHYFALFLIAPEAAWLLFTGGHDVRRRLLAVAVPALAGLSLLPLAIYQRSAVGDPGGIGGRSLATRVVAIPKNFMVGFAIPAEALVESAALLLATLALVLALRSSRGPERSTFFATVSLALASVLLPIALAAFGLDYASSRNVIATLAPAAIALSCGFVVGRTGRAVCAAICILSVATVAGVALGSRYQRPDWRGAARALGPARTARVVMFNPPFANPGPFRVYFGRSSWILGARVVRVREVDVVALAEKTGFGPGTPEPPGGPDPSAPPGFRRARRVATSTFRLVRFVAARPRTLAPAQYWRLAFRDAPPVAVWQTPPR